MAIAFDNSLGDTNPASGTSFTQAYTVTGANTALVVGIAHTTAANVSSVTYAATNLVQIHANIVGENTTRVDLWYLQGTATGSNNVVITMSASDNIRFDFLSYTGVGAGGDTGNSDSKKNLSWSAATGNEVLTTITVANNAWVAFYGRTQNGYTAGTNVTYRQNNSNVVFAGDGGPKTPAGSFSQTFTQALAPDSGAIVGVGMAPVSTSKFLPIMGVGT